MAIEYRLILADTNAVEKVAERALPNNEERPAGATTPLKAGLQERYGFDVSFRAGQNRFFDAESDTGMWQWEPARAVWLTFWMAKDAETNEPLVNMLTVVRRVLDTGSEDAALELNGNWLLLTRMDGTLTKHHRESWWDHYPGANDRIPG